MTATTQTQNDPSTTKLPSASVIPITQKQDVMDIDQAAELYQQAKAAMAEAKAAMDIAENRLIELVNNQQEEGTESREGKRFRVKVSNKLTRKLDDKALLKLQGIVPDVVLDMCFKWKVSLDIRAYRLVLNSDAPYIPALQSVVTAKPAKTSLTVEVL
ncbi:MAG: hypothetical protein CR991_10295 [Proteobacteria bacterium]|nr:MAG: hypothetical protein CR991_10295 [Pseudomonadota bacterium]